MARDLADRGGSGTKSRSPCGAPLAHDSPPRGSIRCGPSAPSRASASAIPGAGARHSARAAEPRRSRTHRGRTAHRSFSQLARSRCLRLAAADDWAARFAGEVRRLSRGPRRRGDRTARDRMPGVREPQFHLTHSLQPAHPPGDLFRQFFIRHHLRAQT
jgi:hypothetical protein